MSSKKKIVILGAGFGGIRAAVLLAKRFRAMHLLHRYEIILVDRNDHHTYTPLLYEVAATSKETANIAHLHEIATHKITVLIRNLPITFLKEDIIGIDVVQGEIRFASQALLTWNYLVLALGSEVNYFGIKGLQEHALPLKTFRDAIAIRNAIWNVAMMRTGDIRIVVGGAGPTGVELAGELDAWCGELQDQFPACNLHVTLVEAGPSILGGFAPKIIALAKRRLSSLGINIIERAPIAEARKNSVVLADGRTIPYDVLAWTGGVKAPAIVSDMQLKTELHGRIEVTHAMECIPRAEDAPLHGKMYALGDSTFFTNPATRTPVAGVARAAISEANIVAANILEDVKSDVNPGYQPFLRAYRPLEYPYVIPIGGKYAIAKLGPIILSGLVGWLLKGVVELNYLLSIMPISYALMTWWRGLRAFMQNDRLG